MEEVQRREPDEQEWREEVQKRRKVDEHKQRRFLYFQNFIKFHGKVALLLGQY